MAEYDIYLLAAESDRAAAEALYAGMRAYKLPKGVRPGNGLDPHRIFMDAGEAAVTAETEHLLDEAGYMIVLFSPAARASGSVMDKLYYFERVTGRESIVPVIADGEPADIFPPMFIQHRKVRHILPDLTVAEMDETVEPVAADLRGSTPKRRKELLRYETVRITASVLDLHPDALEQRHRRRRKQAVAAAVGLLAAVLTVIACVFTVLGIRAHKEGVIAQKQADLAVQTADRLILDLPEHFADEPEALEIIDEAVARAREALAENGLDDYLGGEG